MDSFKLGNMDSRSAEALARLSAELEHRDAQDIVRWAVDRYPAGLVLACSFGAEDMVLVDMLTRVHPAPIIFYLDTGLLFPETYRLIDEAQTRYGFECVRVVPELTAAQQEEQYGDALWSRHPDHCCALRKVKPLQRYLADKSAWMTGIRRDQTLIRKNAPIVDFDRQHGLMKINPLAVWSSKDVFRYLIRNRVPYNPLHDHGYPSIGCMPCTRPVNPGDDARSGRWAGQEKTECGLHL
ncbi:MAG: phosphoadenylyl-sulfate reductase [Thermaerobacter sp.]|nr:phosphoadenylyl-sulfate reductase [Thermaerobacter sp.]